MGESVSGKGVDREERIAEGVYIRRNAAGEPTSLRIHFKFRGQWCRERLNLIPTKVNQRFAVALRGEIVGKIGRNEFNYADYALKYFPDSKMVARFGAVASSTTVADLLDEYERITQPTVEASTWKGYKKVITRCLRPWLGTVLVRDLTAALIEEKVLAAARGEAPGQRPGKGITLKSARNILSPLNMALRRAVTVTRHIPSNPMASLDLALVWPKKQLSTGWKPEPFTFEEMTAIFAACSPAEADYWRVAFGTGMRPSEQIELHWFHVDHDARRLRIETARVTGIEGADVKGPKTDAGNRVIELTQGAYEALQRQHERTGGKDGHVFLDARYGRPWADEQALRKRWARILKKAEVRYRNPYQTRHTFASTLLAAGHRPLRVAKWMGHETTEMLERHYAKWIEQGSHPETQAALDAFFMLSTVQPPAQIVAIGGARS